MKQADLSWLIFMRRPERAFSGTAFPFERRLAVRETPDYQRVGPDGPGGTCVA
jgi:hypothetical protein